MNAFYLNTVSYRAMTLPGMIDAETAFQKTEEFQKMKIRQSKNRMMAAIYQTMRSGKRLPIFADDHYIRPPVKTDAATD